MAGNEIQVAKYIFDNLGKLELEHIGLIKRLSVPYGSQILDIDTEAKLNLLSTQDAGKKADIYLNGHGVSVKQTGGSFPFNRLQRAELLDVFNLIGLPNCDDKLARIDKEVNDFHEGKLNCRTRPWNTFFEEADFRKLTKFLMTEGSPNKGYSKHKAEYILEAPSIVRMPIYLHTFDEYFEEYKGSLYLSIRRQWIGQSSQSEHRRALGIARKPGNHPWVFNSISGKPRNWRVSVQPCDRRTVYLLFIEKKPK